MGDAIGKINKFIEKLRNNPVIVILALLCGAVIFMGKLTDSFDKTIDFIGKHTWKSPTQNIDTQIKEFIDITAEQLLQSIQYTNTQLQADNIARTLYYGKYVRWRVGIKDVSSLPGDKAEVTWEHGFSIFDDSKPLMSLKNGIFITFSGRIQNVSYKSLIELDRCELLEIHNLAQ